MDPFRKGDLVHYRDGGGRTIQAVVRTAHKDGTYTVEAQFVLPTKGVYLGYRFRLSRDELGALQPPTEEDYHGNQMP